MDYKTFKESYTSAPIRFLWEYEVVEDYLLVINKTTEDTVSWFKMSDQDVSEELAGVIIQDSKRGQKRFALYIKNRRINNMGSIYSIFKENFNVITKGYDDRTVIPIPPQGLDQYKSWFVEQGKSEEQAEAIWRYTQSFKREITRFETLANKSINRQRRVTPKLRMQVLARDGFRCILCGRNAEESTIHVDHIIPVSRGGSNEIDYLATLCLECNLGKGNRCIEEIIQAIGNNQVNSTDVKKRNS